MAQPPATATATAAAYGCAACGADLNLSASHLYPAGTYFEAGNKGTLSFSWVDESRLRFAAEDRIRPYHDGPPVMEGTGQLGMGPSQVIPRRPRYRIKVKAVTATTGSSSSAAAAAAAAPR